uniref:Uncharacterized protein n=1 Tax=Chromera velia CCMP2878 TaxID=1169474 RepID=A0A0G4HH03_9ALVE|mmetsp:Transcript_52925/g.103501  ORF Transcript_52925/g.103501 Transcript_52925/m.103501 type:complete len:203 (-) Transcript_52925:765-1373(-)|eukprot:Cvel_6804.t1-p1 / transcript=Cvel_6804.t1 / gene=Cvel_6804 / organism=Chromera_velia_CCMP2878 / gene_product=hypothetical protein / transcript_product=hypothetical protein / location=Cvel_scaffold342:79328-80379(-) / protein_length=202 / sequence_SO=supercontig / SO=protein_coding / is_pseudo=false
MSDSSDKSDLAVAAKAAFAYLEFLYCKGVTLIDCPIGILAGARIPLKIKSNVGCFLHVPAADFSDGVKLTTWEDSTHVSHKWFIERVPGSIDRFFIRPVGNPKLALCVEGETENGAQVTLKKLKVDKDEEETDKIDLSAQFYFLHAGENTWVIRFVHSESHLTVQEAKADNGTPTIQWNAADKENPSSEHDSMKWTFFSSPE